MSTKESKDYYSNYSRVLFKRKKFIVEYRMNYIIQTQQKLSNYTIFFIPIKKIKKKKSLMTFLKLLNKESKANKYVIEKSFFKVTNISIFKKNDRS